MNSSKLKELAKKVPLLRRFVGMMRRLRRKTPENFTDSAEYWKRRYKAGGDSGDGSRGEYARFKAGVINRFAREREISTVVEYGCGDGSQLALADYPSYVGFEISTHALETCRARFVDDRAKSFKLTTDYAGERAELTLSIDVIYHLVEDEVFDAYMKRLFDSSDRFVVIYSSNSDIQGTNQAPHVRHRAFSRWVERERPGWILIRRIGIPASTHAASSGDRSGSQFYIYERA
jgi:hypothetical protein